MSTLSVDTIQGKTTAGSVDFPSGTVVQQVNYTDVLGSGNRPYQSVNSQTFGHCSNFDISITPKFSSSKIYYSASLNLYGNSSSSYAYAQVYRSVGGTDTALSTTLNNGGHVAITESIYMQCPIVLIDSPNTTSQVTYKIFIRSHSSGGTVYLGWTSNASAGENNVQNVVMEIRA
jgi:hypothetical protein